MSITPTSLAKPTFRDVLWHKHLGRPYRLHVRDYGGSGPVIIMLHGLASSSATWKELIPLVSDSYRCITIDLLGFGGSPKPQWYAYTMEDHLRCLHHTIQRLRLPPSDYTLLGHSLGSLLATRYAREYTRKVNNLILLSPPVYGSTNTILSKGARRKTSMYLRAYRFLGTHPRVNYQNFLRLSRIIPLSRLLVLDEAAWIPFIRSLKQCIENQTIVEDIATVQAQIDIFYGLYDEVVVPYNVKQLARSRTDIHLHPLRLNHIVGKRYAKVVAKLLLATIR